MSSRSFWTVMAVLGVVAVIGLLGFGLVANEAESLELGDATPDKPLPRLGAEGELEIADFRGEWVFVNFWASWCPPCRTEAPAIEAFWRKHRDEGFTVLGINSRDLSDDGLAFAREFGLTYPLVRDGDGERSDAFGMVGFPESFLVDPEGNLALIRRGPVDEAYLDEYVRPIIERGARERSK
jgi:cytochrome c biogenesis protein CcmG/thiol:disulfide interchange protein DsbE